MNNCVITVVRDPEHFLGKRFDKNAGGMVSKKSAVNLSFGIAVQHCVSTHADLAKLLHEVGNDPSAAIINASFEGIEIGEEFAILSEREIESQLGIPASDRARQKGVHQIKYGNRNLKAVGRFKENVRPSSWQLLDRDIDEHTPAEFATLSIEAWLAAVGKILPGIEKVGYVLTPSTSSRVMVDGMPIGGGNGHVWIKVANPDDIERFRSASIICAAQAGLTWLKPRFSRKDGKTVVGQSLTTIIDSSVWTPGRLVFVGQPTVGEGLTVEPLSAVVHEGEHDALDTSIIVVPDAQVVRDVTRKAGVQMKVTLGGNGLRISTNDLTLATEIETKEHGILTVREIIAAGIGGKLRCQTPFRDSESWAAFFNRNAEGIPFVYDVGTGITHWLDEFAAEKVKIIPAAAVVKALIPKVKDDSAAVLEDDAVEALATIKHFDPAEYQRARAALKAANKAVSLTAVDRSVKACISEAQTAETHHGYAKSMLAELTEGTWGPVGHQGVLYAVNGATGLWESLSAEFLIRRVAETHDTKEHCSRSSDYRAVAEHTISLAKDDCFFADAPNGLACAGGFYQIILFSSVTR